MVEESDAADKPADADEAVETVDEKVDENVTAVVEEVEEAQPEQVFI